MLIEKTYLEYHQELNPRLWDQQILKPNVRDGLLRFAEMFRGFTLVKPEWIIDIVMTGGNANYNYTISSDIDVHIVIDYTIMGDFDLVSDYLMDKKKLWTLSKHYRISGYNLEPYVADVNEPYPQNQGVYSLKNNTWVRVPINLNLNFDSNVDLEQKTIYYDDLINHIIDNRLGKDEIKVLKDKLKMNRSLGIAKEGEFALDNLVFKNLRNEGSLDKLNQYERSLDKEIDFD